MAEAGAVAAEQEAVVTLEGKHLEAPEDTRVRVFYTARGQREDESDSATQPLLRDVVCDESDKAGMRSATDGADRLTSVPQELELAGRDEPGPSGSVRSLCSDSSRHECPICSELFDPRGGRRVTLLHCNHALCHHCVAGIMRRAKDQSRLRCPFCRQTTPFPQWEIRRLQEESYYGGDVYEPGPAPVASPGPELPAVPGPPLCCFAVDAHRSTCCEYPSCLVEGLTLTQPRSLCFSITAMLLLFLLLLVVFLYMVVPVIMLSILVTNG
ncbi:hypothetical protein VZT92_010218 [Zoarces viviparus]|uniref:E3 ubiquitin-protein ligase RNF182 n=1 Tax=Zoarces viviparus TaxID=48416 RepID=A0AAW1FDU2_ZOAVI